MRIDFQIKAWHSKYGTNNIIFAKNGLNFPAEYVMCNTVLDRKQNEETCHFPNVSLHRNGGKPGKQSSSGSS